MGEQFEVLINKRVTRRAKKIPGDVKTLISKHIHGLRDEPMPQGAIKLQGNLEGFRLRVGDYRILYTVDFKEKIVVIYLLLHRSEGYPNNMP